MQQKLSAIPPWLDAETSALVKEKIDLLVSQHPDLLAVILYGIVLYKRGELPEQFAA